ncbi:13484_t:CDS:1 [Ambispora gerdemannii]|uniref:13484_t:CDS:1 n=1 Tax=Ambispora gerdemannii TaxID=144530 RepID=A0A9N8VXG3_9GLOM|nr:13484_t:CDS:1 [Ambispora gerdemannii]
MSEFDEDNILDKIKVPFPPNITPEEVIILKNGKIPSKSPNCFIIYRRAFQKELRASGHLFKLNRVSVIASRAWEKEPTEVKKAYKEVARQVNYILVEMRASALREKNQLEKENLIRQQQQRQISLECLSESNKLTSLSDFDVDESIDNTLNNEQSQSHLSPSLNFTNLLNNNSPLSEFDLYPIDGFNYNDDNLLSPMNQMEDSFEYVNNQHNFFEDMLIEPFFNRNEKKFDIQTNKFNYENVHFEQFLLDTQTYGQCQKNSSMFNNGL